MDDTIGKILLSWEAINQVSAIRKHQGMPSMITYISCHGHEIRVMMDEMSEVDDESIDDFSYSSHKPGGSDKDSMSSDNSESCCAQSDSYSDDDDDGDVAENTGVDNNYLETDDRDQPPMACPEPDNEDSKDCDGNMGSQAENTGVEDNDDAIGAQIC